MDEFKPFASRFDSALVATQHQGWEKLVNAYNAAFPENQFRRKGKGKGKAVEPQFEGEVSGGDVGQFSGSMVGNVSTDVDPDALSYTQFPRLGRQDRSTTTGAAGRASQQSSAPKGKGYSL